MPPARQGHFAQVTVDHRSAAATVVVLSMNRFLDLNAQVENTSRMDPTSRSPVPLAPRLVVGEGPSPMNHTLVRILNKYQICQVQFLAYPPSVRGGVAVDTAHTASGKPMIVTHPLADSHVREIRIFDDMGGFYRSFDPGHGLSPPYFVAAGAFVPDHAGDEIAVTCSGVRHIVLFDLNGDVIKTIAIRAAIGAGASLSRGPGKDGDDLLLYNPRNERLYRIRPTAGQTTMVQFAHLPGKASIYPSPWKGTAWLAGGPQSVKSMLLKISPTGAITKVNLGYRENIFWVSPPYYHHPNAKDRDSFGPIDGRYVKKAWYAFCGSPTNPLASPPMRNGYPDPAKWPAWRKQAENKRFRKRLALYKKQPPKTYAMIETHRSHLWFMREYKGPRQYKNLNDYLMFDKHGKPWTYHEGKASFANISYAMLPNRIYGIRAELQKLISKVRGDPSQFIFVEPMHEHEIPSPRQEDSIGDYNPRDLRWFARYLLARYGNLKHINRRFHTPFTKQFFDAPRGLGRGKWDKYDPSNPYYRVWYQFNAFMIDRWMARMYREALLAGFAPETITCHQIPDSYAIGDVNDPEKLSKHITPITWALANGANFGFTRYGLVYRRPHNIYQGAFSSGYSMMDVGEYHPIQGSVEDSTKQLIYMFDHGVAMIDGMPFRQKDHQLERSIQQFKTISRPRPGVTGGLLEARTIREHNKPMELVSIGTGTGHPGLIKSISANGRWDGRIYVSPFHAQVKVSPIKIPATMTIGPRTTTVARALHMDVGDQLELTFQARSSSPTTLTLRVANDGGLLSSDAKVQVGRRLSYYRMIVKTPMSLQRFRLALQSDGSRVDVDHAQLVRESEMIVRVHHGVLTGKRHDGGVSFDVLQ